MIRYRCDGCGVQKQAATFISRPYRRRRPYGWIEWSQRGKARDACSDACAKIVMQAVDKEPEREAAEKRAKWEKEQARMKARLAGEMDHS